jgi:hypothetical protein
MQTFYHGLTTSTRETMDATAGGVFLSLTLPVATTLVEKMASNQGFKSSAIATAIARYSCLRKIKLFVSMYNLAAIARYIPI